MLARKHETSLATICGFVFIVGVNAALLEPVLSLYLYKSLKFTPKELGVFYGSLYAGAILFSLFLPYLGDILVRRKRIMIATATLGVLGYGMLLQASNVTALVLTAAFLLAPAASITTQIFSYVRQSDSNPERLILARGAFSASWAIGPAISAFVVSQFGYQALFGTLVALGLVALGFITSMSDLGIPDKGAKKIDAGKPEKGKMALLFVAFALLQGTNAVALVYTPIIVKDRLNMGIEYSGYLFTTCAAIEIVCFYLLAKLSHALDECATIIVGAGFALLYFILLLFSHKYSVLLCAQIFNAIFIAIINGIGMAWFQSFLPNFPGLATGLFLNSFRIGSLCLLPLATFVSSRPELKFGDGIVVSIGATIISICILLFLLRDGSRNFKVQIVGGRSEHIR
jgi:MFS transporter, SET family, sugar efflux transporter